ncbi:MAG: phosphatidylserine decarboxylase [Candidatus Hydrogenedentes bacterium]|nr:phosphatidylserine decarboxylase [Candidatus Hydrogenedentota bacterium]
MTKPFSGWREGARFYLPVLIPGILLAALAPTPWNGAGAFLLLVAFCVAAFFRDFPRTITAAPDEVVSPADGTIVAIEDLDESPHYSGPSRRISIFLSVFNAHLNRAPFDGEVSGVKYASGQFKDARLPETSKINESNAVWMETAKGPVTVRQISGAVARRIVCPVTEGTRLTKGEKFGMIRFGSRTELYLPPGTEVLIANGDKVYAGTTIVARFS